MSGPRRKTLERVISKAGLGSRRQARSWIHARRVTVNGRVVENPDQWVDPARDRLAIDGQPLQSAERRYVLLYKPKGYVTTRRDPEGRKTVYDLLVGVRQFLSPVGRLDLDTSGLLILTNDTRFAELLTNPEHRVEKTYLVKCASRLDDAALEALRRGVALDDGPTRPAKVSRRRDSGSKTFLEITLTEGRNRQVRRMIAAVGSRVLKLVRVRIGPVSIGDLAIGAWRDLTAGEVRMLKREAHGGSSGSAGSLRKGNRGAGGNRKAARDRGPSARGGADAV